MRPVLQLLQTIGAVFAFFLEVLQIAATRPRYVGETLRTMAVLVRRCIIPVGLDARSLRDGPSRFQA